MPDQSGAAPALIELDAVTKRFGDATAVDAISLAIPRGELCVLVGTSGCGKSTTLRMINRLIEHSSGQIRIDGQQIRDVDEQRLRRRIGYAIQSTGLFPHWTVARNIGLVPRLLRWPAARIAARVSELLALLGLDEDEFAGKYPHQLSGGQAQRVGVARALAADPEILLMDEPFGALDPITRESLQDELLRLQARLHKTIVFVTHDMDEALKLADRLVVMDTGRIVQQGSAAALLQAPANAFVESLLGGRDRGLKHAALTRVAERMRPLTDAQAGGPAVDTLGVSADDSLRQALSLMLWHGVDSLLVSDTQGQVVGSLSLQDAVVERNTRA
ncbi:osmoprotectant transport system ATP-binding protein [Franzmannia pantelleriensis]|uniref:Quaternary amine transport ATP-binding protein n=1 Tax=Franzmannia pantelleriensis TaxID=48727 RepID=A0A1G9MLH7_9GAMM|nr:ABC transporter ATP-binding protein [Halomonas pantelleriensis]SDL74505.1 osmoprotectant transport system ATP-binding protein [Halomonas pantelleriensis]